MTETHIETTFAIITPRCDACGGPTRIYGIEPHQRLPSTDINTYVCDACDTSQVLTVPLKRKLG